MIFTTWLFMSFKKSRVLLFFCLWIRIYLKEKGDILLWKFATLEMLPVYRHWYHSVLWYQRRLEEILLEDRQMGRRIDIEEKNEKRKSGPPGLTLTIRNTISSQLLITRCCSVRAWYHSHRANRSEDEIQY